MITYEKAHELFRYDPETGKLFNRTYRNSRARCGLESGDYVNGYRRVRVGGRQYQVHRVIWLLVYGKWPKNQIDHISHVRDDNRISNLREATNQENHRNTPIRADNTSGIIGVYWVDKSNKWGARICVDGKNVHLGSFDNISDASCARKSAEIKYGFHVNHGNCMI